MTLERREFSIGAAATGLIASARHEARGRWHLTGIPTTPPFVKALSIEDIVDNENVLVAYEMNRNSL
jgi:hypothetical protein